MKRALFGLIIPLFTVFFSCKKDVVITAVSSVEMNTSYFVDGDSLVFDTILYKNAAGNQYSVNHLEYYLSGFSFRKQDGGAFISGSVFYLNARESSKSVFVIPNVPQGSYSGLSFYIGLDPEKNKTNYLPNTLQNINMAWPVPMGGGYHFMKMEGYFLDSAGKRKDGYAMHLGNNVNLVKVELNTPLTVTENKLTRRLIMNINEWYKNPYTYSFEKDGNYSMSLPGAMSKLSQNGKDVFTIK